MNLRLSLKWYIYSLLCFLADTLDTILFSCAPRTKIVSQSSEFDGLTDEEVIEYVSRRKHISVDRDVVGKDFEPYDSDVGKDVPEANALNLVFTRTTIPVPRVHRVVYMESEYKFLIIMDHIKGPLLLDVWSELSVWKKIWVAFTLRRYVRQLRRLKASPSTPPGPISADGPRFCESNVWGEIRDTRGPFASHAEFAAFFDGRSKLTHDHNRVPKDDPLRKDLYDTSFPLVLTHQHISLSNIILGEDGRLWIKDWSTSGYYPTWWEYMAMVVENELLDDIRRPHIWDIFVPFICGPYYKEQAWLKGIMWAMYCG